MSRVGPAVAGLLVAALLAAGCSGGESTEEESAPAPPAAPPATGTGAPEEMGETEAGVPETLAFTSRTVGGEDFEAAELAGAPVVFWFWAAWCSRCAAAAPDVAAMQADYTGDVSVVGVAGLGSGQSGMEEFIDRHQLADFPHLADDDGQVWQRFGVTVQQYYVVLDGAGEIVHDGPSSDAAVREQLDSLVG